MEHPTINELPNELLEMIFDHLNVYDLKDVSLVCKRWSDLAFIGRRMDRVLLMAKFPLDKDLLQSNRKYRHLELRETDKRSAHVKELFQTFNVSSLRVKDRALSHSSLRSILLEVPNLQQLSMFYEPDEMNEMIEPLPVMRKMERLEIEYHNTVNTLPWHTIAPSLHGLKINFNPEYQLEQWSLLSGQLKHVHATFHGENSLNRFCEMTFPLLEELSMRSVLICGPNEAFVQLRSLLTHHEIFRRNASLRRLRLDGIFLTKTLVQEITNHNKKLTSLEIIGVRHEYERNGEPGSLESLSQLPELKHLRLNNLDTSIFRGCEALTSLQSLSINLIKFNLESSLGFLQDVFKIAPQLRCLELGSFKKSESATHFICNKFTKLTSLRLTYSEEVSRDCLSGIDRLPHLWYLELDLIDTHRLITSNIPRNKVRCLTLHFRSQYDGDELLRLPEIFPQLDRLNLINWRKCRDESIVGRLRKLLPTCAIKIYGYLTTDAAGHRYGRTWLRSEMMPVWEKEWMFKKHI